MYHDALIFVAQWLLHILAEGYMISMMVVLIPVVVFVLAVAVAVV